MSRPSEVIGLINVTSSGIVSDFRSNLHNFNKRAYTFLLLKNKSDNTFNSRFEFSESNLQEGEYTLCIEFFYPQGVSNWAVSPFSSSVDVVQYHTKHFNNHNPKYLRTIAHIHKEKTEPNAAIFLDITSYPGDLKYPSHPPGYLIFYGVKGYQDDVDGNVYDQIFSTDGGKLALQTDLDLNGHSLNGFTKYDNFSTNTNNHLTLQSDLHLNGHSIIGLASPPKRQHIITGIFNKSLNRDYVLFNGSLFYISLINLKIKRWHFYIIDKKNISIK